MEGPWKPGPGPRRWGPRLSIAAVLTGAFLLFAISSLFTEQQSHGDPGPHLHESPGSRPSTLVGSNSQQQLPVAGLEQRASSLQDSVRASEQQIPRVGSSPSSSSSSSSTGSSSSSEEGGRGRRRPIKMEPRDAWNYQCWVPPTPSSPSLTLASVVAGLPDHYIAAVRTNRLAYAARHGYTYCELASLDPWRVPAWSKLPWILALAPCSDYVLHIDADAFLYDQALSCRPLMDYMAATGADQLLSADIIKESPINFGVFMIRNAPWIWPFWQRLYNVCPCDFSRTHDWPAEQGLIYDLLAGNLTAFEFQKTKLVGTKGWNHIIGDQALPAPGDLISHMTHPKRYPPGSGCEGKKLEGQEGRRCKYVALAQVLTSHVAKKYPTEYNTTSLAAHFTLHTNNTPWCQPVTSGSLFTPNMGYANRPTRRNGSVVSFDTDPVTGEVLGVKVDQIGCVGWREETKCGLRRHWDTRKGVGPWVSTGDNVLEGAAAKKGQTKQRRRLQQWWQQRQQKQRRRHLRLML